MRIIDKCLISFIAVRNTGEKALKTIHGFWHRKAERRFRAVANRGELKGLIVAQISLHLSEKVVVNSGSVMIKYGKSWHSKRSVDQKDTLTVKKFRVDEFSIG
jgi:hypothetical protein